MTYITQKNDAVNTSFARNPILLVRPQTLVLHQILRHASSSEFIPDELYYSIYVLESTMHQFKTKATCFQQ
jgi:hypothetical protein